MGTEEQNLSIFLLQAFVISLSGVMAPGPVSTSAIALGARNRFAGLLIGVGHCIIELPLVVALVLGLGAFFKSETAQMATGIGGGLFLLFMAAGMFRDTRRVGQQQQPKLRSSDPVLAGIMFSATNPYFPLWWLAVGLNLVMRASTFGAWAIILFALIHWLCDCGWLEVLSWASFKGTRVFGWKGQRVVLAICAGALAVFGLLFLWGGARILLR